MDFRNKYIPVALFPEDPYEDLLVEMLSFFSLSNESFGFGSISCNGLLVSCSFCTVDFLGMVKFFIGFSAGELDSFASLFLSLPKIESV